MKKYIKIIPLMSLPGLFILFLIGAPFMFLAEKADTDIASKIGSVLSIVYCIYLPIIAVVNTVRMGIGKYSAKESAKMNLVVKATHITWMLASCVLGLLSFLASVWALAALAIILIVDILDMLLTGTHSIGCVVRVKKDGIISGTAAFFMVLGSFVPIADIIIAILLFVLCKKDEYKKKQEQQRIYYGNACVYQ